MLRIGYMTSASLAAILLVGGAPVTANAAKPEFLGTFADTATATTEGVARLVIPGSATVECLSPSSGTGQVKNTKEGTFDELELGCGTRVAGISVKCTGLPDRITGSILITGKLTLGYELGTTNPFIVGTPGEVHFECSSVLVNLKGCLVAGVAPKNTASLSFTNVHGSAEDYTNDTGKTVSCELLASVNGATFKLATIQAKVNVTMATTMEIMA